MTRQEELTGLLSRYGDAYYDSDAPLVSDAEYDALYDELLALERESGVVLPGSPTRRVGAGAAEGKRHFADGDLHAFAGEFVAHKGQRVVGAGEVDFDRAHAV